MTADRSATPGASAVWLTITLLCDRWSCGRRFAYAAVREMRDAGYIKEMKFGKQHRVHIDSVLVWESSRMAQRPASTLEIMEMRGPTKKPGPKPRTAPASMASVEALLAWGRQQRAALRAKRADARPRSRDTLPR